MPHASQPTNKKAIMKRALDAFAAWALVKLAESRIEEAKRKFPEIDLSSINELIALDPSGNNKYLLWMVGQYIKGVYSGDLASAVKYFHENIRRFKEKDINKYTSYYALLDAIKEVRQTPTRTEIKKSKENSEKIYTDDKYSVYSIKSYEASKIYGRKTKWCITGYGITGKEQFNKYYKNGISFFFFIIPKASEDKVAIRVVCFPPICDDEAGDIKFADKIDVNFVKEMSDIVAWTVEDVPLSLMQLQDMLKFNYKSIMNSIFENIVKQYNEIGGEIPLENIFELGGGVADDKKYPLMVDLAKKGNRDAIRWLLNTADYKRGTVFKDKYNFFTMDFNELLSLVQKYLISNTTIYMPADDYQTILRIANHVNNKAVIRDLIDRAVKTKEFDILELP